MINPYESVRAEVQEVFQETESDLDIKTYKLKLLDGTMMFAPGQFVELALPGVGEAPFGFASSPLERDFIELTIKRVGVVTEAIHNLRVGSTVWIRGPFGNVFPAERMEQHNLLFVAGGLGLAPLRPLIEYVLAAENRAKYNQVQMLLAARSSQDLLFARDYQRWGDGDQNEVVLTIDRPEDGWQGKVGFPHIVVDEMTIDVENTYAVICGPPIMIKFMVNKLVEKGLAEERIYTTLEMRMSCGVGKCGKCNIGHRYVCVDGPVFSMAELAAMPDEY